ncbi:MAG: VOC family protein [Candidatus Eremiobacteraeota bacterium]|nr:VOC family protein [Candidatus Eremiobacteraeota bacterium]MBV9737447.1 VOC family protein [Candidatus Eremiobacteraeota bacterium]
MANQIGHVELTTTDLPRARSFYTALFGWEFTDNPMPGGDGVYAMARPEGGAAAGMLASPPGVPTGWTMFINVDDIKSTMTKARDLGAVVVRDVTEVPGYGALAIVADPTGAVFGLWQTKG